MEILRINPKTPKKRRINIIAKALKLNKVIILPTDTCYGIMGKAISGRAVLKIYKIKGRSFKKPLSCIFRDLKMIKKFAYVSEIEEKLIKRFLPGQLTIVLKEKKDLSNILMAGEKFVGVRIPKNKVIAAVMKKINFPITATSANLSGRKEPYSISEILRQYSSRFRLNNKNLAMWPDFVVDAGRLKKVRPSTVVKIEDHKVKILRRGPISKKEILIW